MRGYWVKETLFDFWCTELEEIEKAGRAAAEAANAVGLAMRRPQMLHLLVEIQTLFQIVSDLNQAVYIELAQRTFRNGR